MNERQQGEEAKAKEWRVALHGWLAIDSPQNQAGAVFRALEEVFAPHLVFSRSVPKQRASLLYTTCCALPDRKLGLCLVHARAATLSLPDVHTIHALLAAAQSDTAIVLCNSPGFADGAAQEAACRLSGVNWVFLTWLDVEEAIDCHDRNSGTQAVLARCGLRFTDALLGGDAPKFSWKPGQAPTDALAERSLPNVRFLLEKLPPSGLVADFGAGRGRHSLYALRFGHSLLAVEKRPDTFAELKFNLERAGVASAKLRLVAGDYFDVKPQATENIDLLVIAGVLQHCADRDDLEGRLGHLADVLIKPGAMLFVEMLFDMKFDGQPKPGRVEISVEEFERLLLRLFPRQDWTIERLAGPVSQVLDFSGGGRSFFSEARLVEQTAAEYLLTRSASAKES